MRRRFANGGMMSCGPNQRMSGGRCVSSTSSYRRGGRVAPHMSRGGGVRKFASGGHTHGHDHYIQELGLRTSHQSVMGWTNHPMNPNPGQEHFGFTEDSFENDWFGGHTAQSLGHHHGRTRAQMAYRRGGRVGRKYRGGGRVAPHMRRR